MILQVQKGCFGYPGQPAILENIDMTLEEGHILAILGPNGIGKTTLLKCMIGLLPWHSGKTLLYDKDIHTLKPKEVWSTICSSPPLIRLQSLLARRVIPTRSIMASAISISSLPGC